MSDIKTSQTSWSLPEGTAPTGSQPSIPAQGTRVPGPVTQPVKGESIKMNITTTSQQDRNEHATPESGD